MLRQFGAEEINAALDYGALADALAAAFVAAQVEAPLRQVHDVGTPAAPGHLLVMPALRRGARLGVKLVNVFPQNGPKGLGAVNGIYVLFDGTNGLPLATLDSDALTNRRTAAASLLAARHLARPDAETLLVVGTGRLATHLARAHFARAHLAGHPLSRVLLFGRDATKTTALAGLLAQEGLPAVPAADLDRAVAEADIITCATTARNPLILGGKVKAGAHVDLVGAFRPDMRESDGALIARARVFADTRAGALKEAGDLVQAKAEGAFADDDLVGDLSDLCAGRVRGRLTPDEVTVFKSVGTALEDLVAAEMVLAASEEGA